MNDCLSGVSGACNPPIPSKIPCEGSDSFWCMQAKIAWNELQTVPLMKGAVGAFEDAAGIAAARAAMPRLTGTIAGSFEGGEYMTAVLHPGTVLYRAESVGQGPGSFFGPVKPATSAEAEKLYNLKKWDNNSEVVSTYRLTTPIKVYVGPVAGGSGTQMLLPRGTDPKAIFDLVSQERLP